MSSALAQPDRSIRSGHHCVACLSSSCSCELESASSVVGSVGSRPHAGCLTDQVIALGDICGQTGGARERRGGGREIPTQLVQVGADGVPSVSLAEHVA